MLERLINVTKTTFFIKNDNFLLKIKNSSQYVLQFLEIGYQIIAFDYGYQHVSWKFSFEWNGSIIRQQGEAGLSENELIRRRLISSIGMVNQNDLTVSNGKFTVYKEKIGKTFLRGDKESITKDTKMSMNIQATIEYRVRALTPLGLYFFNQNGERGIVLRKQLNRYRLLSERTE